MILRKKEIFIRMKKINKIIMGLATVAMLGSCSGGANTVSAAEAKKAVEGLSSSSITYTTAKVELEVTKLSSTGNYSKNYAEYIGVRFRESYGVDFKVGAKVEATVTGTENIVDNYFIDADLFEEYETKYKATFTVNGTAVTIEYSQSESETIDTVTVATTQNQKLEYNAEGLASKEVGYIVSTFGGDSDKLEYEITTTVAYSK